ELEVQDAVLDRVAHRDLTAGGQLQLRPVRIELLHLDASTLQVELQRRLVEVQCREADAALQLGVDDARSVERGLGPGASVTGSAAVALDRHDPRQLAVERSFLQLQIVQQGGIASQLQAIDRHGGAAHTVAAGEVGADFAAVHQTEQVDGVDLPTHQAVEARAHVQARNSHETTLAPGGRCA